MKTSIPPVLIAIALVCFSLLPAGQAVVPPPAGGYPNFTTAAGDHALQALTSGAGNTAVGTFRCLASPLAASTPLLALERLILIREIRIRPLALQRFCLTPTAQKTRPMEQPHLNLTKPASKIRPLEHSPFSVIPDPPGILTNPAVSPAASIQPMAIGPFLATTGHSIRH